MTTITGYTRAQIRLHWLTAALIVPQYVFHDGISDAFEIVGHQPKTNLIYVTHYPSEIPTCMTHLLQFENTQTQRCRLVARRL